MGALATERNRRVGPEALRASYDWARDVRGRVQADPSLLWAAVTHPCVLDAVQQALDVLGMVPGLGEPFDVANAMLSAGRGRSVEAAISLAAAVPGIGQGVTGAKLAARHADELAGAAVGLGRYTDAAAGAVRSCVRANSFDGDTAVATPDGERPIRDIAVGDTVLAYDQATGTTGTYTVTDVIVHYDLMQVDVTIAGETLDTTPEHPFFVLLRGWVAARALRAGDQVRRLDGTYGAVERVQVASNPQPMYNLTVADAHTFFVGDGAWLVHNAAACEALKQGVRVAPSALGTQLAQLADLVFEDLPRYAKGSATVAITKVNDAYVVGVNSAISPRAVRQLQRMGWVVEYEPSFGHAMEGHAERVLYRKYGESIESIGISHYDGPCSTGANNCRAFFASIPIELTWTGLWKR